MLVNHAFLFYINTHGQRGAVQQTGRDEMSKTYEEILAEVVASEMAIYGPLGLPAEQILQIAKPSADALFAVQQAEQAIAAARQE